MNKEEIVPHLFRTEYSKIVAVLTKLFGLEHIQIAEDIVSDTFLLAAETWGLKGLPKNPQAWLYTVSRNKALDALRRSKVFSEKIEVELKLNSSVETNFDIDWSGKNMEDSQLQMMFAICHPAITTEAQIGLSLNILCGFGADEIADAFLSNRDTIYKRLARAKERLKTEKIKLELPPPAEIQARLETVLTTLYLLFSEGYYSSSQNTTLRKDLCIEAMRLNVMLTENELTNTPQANALLALMCFHASRFEARTNREGEFVLYEEQDENLWNQELIAKGKQYLNSASTGVKLSRYHLEAAIAYWHTHKKDSPEKWENILQLYNRLLQIEYSPIAALNRTYALSKANGKKEAIIEAEKLDLKSNHLYYSLLGNLYSEVDNKKAIAQFKQALFLAKTSAEKKIIQASLHKLEAIG
ncbi:MAG: sigma-70 family RNA polymerase sigma factor [Bacteroidetes bacterium]|nr:sigma-70 family RNA polymerase sigma factor [Bacteroidota bacterium]